MIKNVITFHVNTIKRNISIFAWINFLHFKSIFHCLCCSTLVRTFMIYFVLFEYVDTVVVNSENSCEYEMANAVCYFNLKNCANTINHNWIDRPQRNCERIIQLNPQKWFGVEGHQSIWAMLNAIQINGISESISLMCVCDGNLHKEICQREAHSVFFFGLFCFWCGCN